MPTSYGSQPASPTYPPKDPRKEYGPTYGRDARAMYPRFLSLPETLLLQLSWAWKGLLDASRWDIVAAVAVGDPEIRANYFKSLLLNGLSLVSIYVFDLILQPLVRDQQKWLHRNVGWFYQVLWLFPVVGVSLYLNSSWCTVVANRTFTLRHGTRQAVAPSTYTDILTSLATSAYRAVMIGTSIVLSFGLSYVPVIGSTASFMFFCWVDAYYCFEFVWIARGLSLAQRIRYLEERWAYFLAFGVPSSALCMWGGTLANAALFAFVYPSYIIMAMHGTPTPPNPYNPSVKVAPHHSHHHHSPQFDAPPEIRYPSPFIPICLPVFAPVLWINDRIVQILTLGGNQRIIHGKAAGAKVRRFSDSAVESVEEGDGDNASVYGMRSTPGPTLRMGLNDRGTWLGTRRKAD